MTPRVVFDCMVFMQAAARPDGPADACLVLAENRHCELIVSTEILDEVREVISRPGIRKKFGGLSDEEIDALFDRLSKVAILVQDVPSVVTFRRDPDDMMYLNLAVAANAKYVITHDKDLLDLMTGVDPDAEAFRTTYPEIKILDPVAFLRLIRQPAPQDPPKDEP